MKKLLLAPVLVALLIGISSAWSIDGACDNSVESERVLVDFTNFSANVTPEVMERVLWSETHDYGCFNVTFVNSTGVGLSFDFSCMVDNGIGEYLLFDRKPSWYECEGIDWDENINPACNSEERLVHTFNETDWKDYDFLAWDFENSNEIFGDIFVKFLWRGANLFGYENNAWERWEYPEPQQQIRFYSTYYAGYYNATEERLYASLGRNQTAQTNDLIDSDYTGSSSTWLPYFEWYNATKDLNFLHGRWHFDPAQFSGLDDIYNFSDNGTSFEFILKSMKFVEKENQLNSLDCAVPMTIGEFNRQGIDIGGWIVNITGVRLPTNFDIIDSANDFYETAYAGYGLPRLRRYAPVIIADSDSNALTVIDVDYPLGEKFENVSMWDEIYVVGKKGFPQWIENVYEVGKTGNNYRVDYYEEIPDLWEYLKNESIGGWNYFLRYEPDYDYGCRFVKIRIAKGDYFVIPLGSDENVGVSYLFSTEDLCSTGFGCEITLELPYYPDFPVSDDYDLIAVGQLCKNGVNEMFFQPSGLAWDDNGLVGDGICAVSFESYKGDYADTSCRINPTFYSVYMQDVASRFNPMAVGILGITMLVLTGLLFSGKMELKYYFLIVGILVLSTFLYYNLANRGLIPV